MLKEVDDLVILGVTLDSRMTFEKHLCSVYREASEGLCILWTIQTVGASAGYMRSPASTSIFTQAPPRCRTGQYRMIFIPLTVSFWNDLADPIFDGVGLTGYKSRANAFFIA